MNWYYAAEGQRVGPVDEDAIRQLAREGRLTPDTLVWHQGMEEWKRFAELADSVLEAEEPPALEPEPDAEPELVPITFDPTRALAGETRFGIRDCLARGWDVVAARPWLCLGSLLLYVLLYLLTSLLGIVGALIAMPYFAGLYGVFLRISRGQQTNWADLLTPAKRNLLQVLLVQFIPGLLFFVLLRPFERLRDFNLVGQKFQAMSYDLTNPLGLAALLVVSYLGISWAFALPLVVDQSLKFWDAIKLSHRVVARHFFKTLLFMGLCGLFACLGVVIFYFGFVLTAAISLAAMASAYDSLFSPAGSGALPPSNPSGGAAPKDSPPE
jgi:hypothetical protein